MIKQNDNTSDLQTLNLAPRCHFNLASALFLVLGPDL